MLPAELLELKTLLRSWAKVGEATNTDDRLIRKIRNTPGYAKRCAATTRERISRALNARRPRFLTLDYLHAARETLVDLKAEPGSKALENHLIMLDGFLRTHQPEGSSAQIQYLYMRIMVCMSKALHHHNYAHWFGGPKGWEKALQEVEQYAQEALTVAEHARDSDLAPSERTIIDRLTPFVFINWIQAIQEQTKERYRNKDGYVRASKEAKAFFREKGVLPRLRQFLADNPCLWQAACNGLELASTLESDADALWFYHRLVKLDPGFQDFDYSPGEVKAISQEPGMAYFNQKFRPSLHKPIEDA